MSRFLKDRRSFLAASGLGILSPKCWGQTSELSGKDLVIVIPGIMGSELTLRGKDIWTPSLNGVSQALLSLGKNLHSLKLTSDPYDELNIDDGVVATRIVRDVHLIPGLWKIDGYTKLIAGISAVPGIRPGLNFFEFPYDWRRDNRLSAKRLQIATETWLKTWRKTSGFDDAKVVYVAHSMGGLIARYYIECLQGWKTCRRLIAIGTPFRGSLNALSFLHGDQNAAFQRLGLIDLSELVRSFTSVYQLLPVYDCIQEGSIKTKVAETVGISNIDFNKAKDALLFHQSIDAAVAENRKLVEYRISPYKIHPIVGIRQSTLQSAQKSGFKLAMISSANDQLLDGDGTVPRPSATPLELQGADTEYFIAEIHGSLQNSTAVVNQVIGLLTANSTNWAAFRSTNDNSSVSLKLADAFSNNEEILVSGSVDTKSYENSIWAELSEANSRKLLARSAANVSEDGVFRIKFPPQVEGTYRVQIQFTRKIAPEIKSLSDVTCVFPST